MFIACRNGLRNPGLHNAHHSLFLHSFPCTKMLTYNLSIIFNLCNDNHVPYCNVTACEVGPTEQVHYSVETGQFAADLFLSLHHSSGLCTEHVVYWGHHAQT